jgi:hypothetical protein
VFEVALSTALHDCTILCNSLICSVSSGTGSVASQKDVVEGTCITIDRQFVPWSFHGIIINYQRNRIIRFEDETGTRIDEK